jgi:hypothetical protein
MPNHANFGKLRSTFCFLALPNIAFFQQAAARVAVNILTAGVRLLTSAPVGPASESSAVEELVDFLLP